MNLFKNYKSKKDLRAEIIQFIQQDKTQAQIIDERNQQIHQLLEEEKKSQQLLESRDQEIQELTEGFDKSVTKCEELQTELEKQNIQLDFAIQSLNNVSDNIYELQQYIKNLKDGGSGLIVDYEAIENLISAVDTMISRFDIFYTTNVEDSLLETQSYPSGSLGIVQKFYSDERSGNPYKNIRQD